MCSFWSITRICVQSRWRWFLPLPEKVRAFPWPFYKRSWQTWRKHLDGDRKTTISDKNRVTADAVTLQLQYLRTCRRPWTALGRAWRRRWWRSSTGRTCWRPCGRASSGWRWRGASERRPPLRDDKKTTAIRQTHRQQAKMFTCHRLTGGGVWSEVSDHEALQRRNSPATEHNGVGSNDSWEKKKK